MPSQARDRVATSGDRLSPFSITGLTTARLQVSFTSFRRRMLTVLTGQPGSHGLSTTRHSWSCADGPCGSHRQSDQSSHSDQIYVCRTSACWLHPVCTGFLPLTVALARPSLLVLFPAFELAPSGVSVPLQVLASRFAFQTSCSPRSLQPAVAEVTCRYVIGTGKTVFISGPSSAGLRRWM